jgi:GLPGLI family protein
MGKQAGINFYLIMGMLIIFGYSNAQLITSGRIVFERKTNLEKKFSDERMKEWLGGKKSKIDEFELIFNDTISIFKPIENNEVDRIAWTTSKSTVLENLNKNEKLFVLDVAGQQIFVKDSITRRQWKVTDSKRTIDKYRCRQAVYEKNDSTRLYAWYSVDIVPSVGPEGFGGLPGAILGLATEDGSIIYFAKSIEFYEPLADAYNVNTKKKDIFTPESLRAKFEKEMGGSQWAKRMYDEIFRWL